MVNGIHARNMGMQSNNRQVGNNERTPSLNSRNVNNNAGGDQVNISAAALNLLANGTGESASLPYDYIRVHTEEDLAQRARVVEEAREAQANREPVVPRLARTFYFGEGDNAFRISIRGDRVLMASGTPSLVGATVNSLLNGFADNVTEIDLSQGLAGIPGASNIPGLTQNTVEMMRYTQLLLNGINEGGLPDPTVTTSLSMLNEFLFRAAGALEDSAGANINNMSPHLQNAFRNMALWLFDNTTIQTHNPQWGATEVQIANAQREAARMANQFTDRFFNDIREFNTQENLQNTGMRISELSFHHAWNFLQFEAGGMDLFNPWVTFSDNLRA